MSGVRLHGATLIADTRCTLGEGLVWNVHHQAWFWLDIEEARLWTHRPRDGHSGFWRLPNRAGAFVFTASGAVVVGLAKQLVLARLEVPEGRTLETTPLAPVEADRPTTRVNDGRTDRAGHLVFGTMDESDPAQAIGSIYQFSARHGLRRLEVGHVAIANSLCFSPEGDRIYFCCSLTGEIRQGVYDAERASVTDVRPFVRVPAGGGLPDGSVVDADGGLWNAVWGGSAIRRYDREGVLTDVIALPVPHVSCPAFGGADADVLASTTARFLMSDQAVAAAPTAGGLFRASGLAGATGVAESSLVGL